MARDRRKKSYLFKNVTIVVVASIIFGGVLYFLLQDEKSPIDANTDCPKAGPKSVTAVILDTSDPLNPKQIASYEKFMKSLTVRSRGNPSSDPNADENNFVKRHSLLAIYEIQRTPGKKPRELFRRCNPGSPEDSTVSTNKPVAMIRWLNFQKSLGETFPKVVSVGLPASLVLETLGYVRGREFPSVADLQSSKRKVGVIFIISDLLQNSKRLTHFKIHGGLPDPSNIPLTFSFNLAGIDIGFKYLKHPRYEKYYRGNRHFTWWRKVIRHADGTMRAPEVW